MKTSSCSAQLHRQTLMSSKIISQGSYTRVVLSPTREYQHRSSGPAQSMSNSNAFPRQCPHKASVYVTARCAVYYRMLGPKGWGGILLPFLQVHISFANGMQFFTLNEEIIYYFVMPVHLHEYKNPCNLGVLYSSKDCRRDKTHFVPVYGVRVPCSNVHFTAKWIQYSLCVENVMSSFHC